MIYRSLVILVLLFTVIKTVDAVSASACYGTDPTCDFYSLQCASNEMIRLYNLYAGYKNTTVYPICGQSNHCSDKVTCCSLKTTDIINSFNLENTYNTYTNCSGKTSCRDIHAPWQTLNSYPSLTTSYVHLEYECEYAERWTDHRDNVDSSKTCIHYDKKDVEFGVKPKTNNGGLASNKVPFCGGTTGTYTVTDALVEVMFRGSVENFDPLKASRECQCTITNTGLQQDVVLTTIDVRLQTYYKSENQTSAKCSSAVFQSNVLVVQCQESDKHYEDNFNRNRQYAWPLTTGQTVNMSLKHIHANGMHDSPAMVWISLKAQDNRDLRVSCKEVTPADFTSTTTTTTTTTTSTTTPKPTTTSTTTPKPTTTTTTTPKQTTTTTTTPKPTTTTTTMTPEPTTTTKFTTPKPTTTTTTSTPKPTTTITTSTPKPTTTITTSTRKPTTKKMTTTTSKPSTTTSTTPKQTTKSIKTSSAATTPSAALASTTQNQPTSQSATNYIPTTTEAALAGDGESGVEQRTALYLAICIPIIVCMFCITGLLLWIYLKRTSPRKQKLHFMKSIPRRSEVYNAFSNPKILDDFISGVGVEPNNPGVLEKSPISSFISVPVPKTRPKSILSNGSVYREEPSTPREPYVIPIKTTTNPLYMPSTSKNGPVANMVLVNKKNDEPVVITDTVESEAGDDLIKMNDVYDPASENDKNENRENPTQSQKKTNRKPDETDGAVVIHVDNLNLPPVSARSMNTNTSTNTSSTRSVIGSTPGNLTPERRNSEPAIISTDPITERHSASAYVLPGTSLDDGSVLFVK